VLSGDGIGRPTSPDLLVQRQVSVEAPWALNAFNVAYVEGDCPAPSDLVFSLCDCQSHATDIQRRSVDTRAVSTGRNCLVLSPASGICRAG
jgi:hypothetical protein